MSIEWQWVRVVIEGSGYLDKGIERENTGLMLLALNLYP